MKNKALILGDTLTLLIITLIGFATHGETSISFSPRMLTTFIPLLIAWFLLAPWFGLFNPAPTLPPPNTFGIWGRWREATEGVIKVGVAMLFAGPLAVVLRGLILNAPIIPIFAVVLSAASAFGMIIWRALYSVLNRKKT
ncbi:MAG: DUF3054 family protein [Anaerolineales bacterium]